MEKQYWYCIHAKSDQTQISEEDSRLREFLSKNQVSRTKPLLDQASKGFMAHQAKKAMIFCCFKYNNFSNLPNTKEYRFALYGVKGIHDLKRKTDYSNFYFSEEEDLYGINFFKYVFGSTYLTEKEARTDSVKKILDKKSEDNKDKNYNISMNISEKDRILVCKIVERLWSTQIENNSSRLIICMDDENMQSRSTELLKQVYLLLPQRLRLNMGFSTCSTFQDIKSLTEGCDLPIHIFTMKEEDREILMQEKENLKYPVTFFDAAHYEDEICEEERLELLLKLSHKISPSTDAKIAYIEKVVLKEKRGQVSFKNMQQTLEKVNTEKFFWWDQMDLEKIENIYKTYEEQKELMEVDILYQEALVTFYTEMLPWKEYAKQIGEIILDENYPDKDKLLRFFSHELKFLKIIDAIQYVKDTVEKKAAEHEQLAIVEIEEKYIEEIELQRQKHNLELDEKKISIEKLERDNIEKVEKYKNEIKEQKSKFQKEMENQKNQAEEKTQNMKCNYEKQLAAQKEKFDRTIDEKSGSKKENVDIKFYKDRIEKLEQEKNKNNPDKKLKVLSVIFGIFCITIIAFSTIYTIRNFDKIQVLQSEQQKLESEREKSVLAYEKSESERKQVELEYAKQRSEHEELKEKYKELENQLASENIETESDEYRIEHERRFGTNSKNQNEAESEENTD